MREAMKLAGFSTPAGALGESRRKASILNDAFSKLGLYWAFRAFETGHADRVGIQFRAALGKKLDQQRCKLPPNNTQI